MSRHEQQTARHFRPKWHYTPQQGWINDPNGLVYLDGTYHLFAQYHPFGTVWGPMHWAHATSRNLIDWTHEPIALAPDDLGTIFSGGAVLDVYNTSGFAAPETDAAPLILMFTHNGSIQQQSIAWSTDYRLFHKYQHNPVIANDSKRDFRDPKPFWNPLLHCWSCAVAAGDHIAYYSSPDLKKWAYTGRFGPEGNHLAGVWECPDLFSLQTPAGETRWVQIVSMGRPQEQGGPCTQYFIGSFDGKTFAAGQTEAEPLLLDPGFDCYAAISFDHAPQRILIGWGNSWVYAHETPTGRFRGAMTLPRIVTLVDTPAGLRLAAQPWPALSERLLEHSRSDQGLPLTHESFGLQVRADGPFVVQLANDAQEMLQFGLDPEGNFFIDRGQSSHLSFSAAYDQPLYQIIRRPRLSQGPVALTAFFDVSMLELFADDGLFACNSVVYPQQPYSRLCITGAATVRYLAEKSSDGI